MLKQVAHRVDEDQLRHPPGEWFRQLFWHEAQIEALFVRMPFHTAEALGEGFGIAVLTSRADLRAAANGIPGSVGPLDLGVTGHCSSRITPADRQCIEELDPR